MMETSARGPGGDDVMLADQDHPLEDAIAEAGAKPDPALVVVYRTRGVPWLLVPPLLLLAGVAAIVIYRRSEVSEHAAAIAWRDASSHRAAARTAAREPGPPGPDAPARLDALDELTSATGRPASALAARAEGPSFDPTPPPDETEPPKPAPPPVELVRVAEKPKVEQAGPTESTPQPAATAPDPTGPRPAETKPATSPDIPPASAPAPVSPPEPPARPTAVADPFDPLIATPRPARAVPVEPPAAADVTSHRDRVGFDPQATPATLEAEARPEPEQPAPDRAAVPSNPPPAEQPFELDRRKPGGAGGGAADRRAERTREIELDMQAEAERRLAEKTHLKELKDAALNPDPAEYRRQREAFKAAVRKVTAEERPAFHEELKRLIREQGRAAGPDIKATRDRFGVDTLPEIMQPAARDLLHVASRMTTGERIRRMRQWGLPETMVIDDLYEHQVRNIGAPGAARDEAEAWVFAAWTLLHYAPGTPRTDAQPAAAAPR